VLDYVQGWIDRIEANDGIIPDNVGATGVVGEARDGQWWGGLHGWSTGERAIDRLFLGLIIGAECAHLLSGGDDSYLEVLRSQVRVLMENSIETETESRCMVVPTSYGADGWDSYGDFSIRGGPPHLTHLYHASMSEGDHDTVTRVRDRWMNGGGDDWNDIPLTGDRGGARTEFSRFQYYDGKNPDWPMKILTAEYNEAITKYEEMMEDDRLPYDIITTNQMPQHLVLTKGLTQVTMGTPQATYNGGLLRATVRYFDKDRGRAGLPPDTAALVDELRPDGAGIQLVNTNHGETRRVIVQAGAFGEHDFTEVSYHREGDDGDTTQQVHGKAFVVELPPSTAIRLNAGMNRYVNKPSYAFPWHGDSVPIPFHE
jgi:hypothetical protein